ncbi:MAG: Ig-like domain-containing protein [Candidatus Rokubacteria bacterium]|nr:Ig-like domain-containing protein [Candidatus Rokubacteria bacterium]
MGGLGVDGRVVAEAERFDPAAQRFEALTSAAPTPRAYHTATLLTDGRLLIVGGIAEDGVPSSPAETWDPQAGTTETVRAGPAAPRLGHTAMLLPDGSVLISGGVDRAGVALTRGEVYDAGAGRFAAIETPQQPAAVPTAGPRVEFSVPSDGATDVPLAPRLVLRFSVPARVETVTSKTVTLSGPEGPEAVTVTAAEGGMLVFIRPNAPLLPGATYTLSLNGTEDGRGLSLPFTAVQFRTREAPAGPERAARAPAPGPATHSGAADPGAKGDAEAAGNAEDWEWRGERRDGQPYSRWQALPPLQAPAGVTALAGQVLKLNGEPLPDVTLRIGGRSVQTDTTGRFLLTDLPAGGPLMVIDGSTASRPGRTYARFIQHVDLTAGVTTVLPYTIWLALIDTKHVVRLPVPTTREVVVTTPRVPGLEMRIPAGVVLRHRTGEVVREVSLTRIPTDRPPFPLPKGTDFFFTPELLGAHVERPDGTESPVGVRFVLPNYQGLAPGVRVDLWDYLPEHRWRVSGQGTVRRDGRQILPDPGVEYLRVGCIFTLGSDGFAPTMGPIPGAKRCCDPVDPATGLFVLEKTDLIVPDVIPIVLMRTYRPGGLTRQFGAGANHPYFMFLVGEAVTYSSADLVRADGSKIHYVRTSPGTGQTDAVMEHTATPTAFDKSQLAWNATRAGWDITLRDGTVYEFAGAAPAPGPPLTGIRDRWGNRLTIEYAVSRQIKRITTPSWRWLEFTYTTTDLITQARDHAGRVVNYEYDGFNRLTAVVDAGGGRTEYTWDPGGADRMLTLKDARGIVFLTNEYDAANRVTRQTQADGTSYQLAYTLDLDGKIVQTDITNPRGDVRRLTFNAAGYPLTHTAASGTPLAQTTTYVRDTANRPTSIIDALGRQTAYAYDAQGNLTSLTRLAGTGEAVTTGFTYEPLFSQVASVTDPLGHTTTLAYDAAGNPTTITSPLGVATTLTWTAAGQPLTITTPAGTTQLGYDLGDLVTITDPLGRITTRFTDLAGRLVSVTDSRGGQTRYAYDALNRLTSLTDALGGVTQFSYDPNGNLLAVTDARGSVTGYSYDSMDRVATRTDPLLRVESYQYDLAGNLTQVTDRKGQVTTVSYDALNRRTSATYADASTTSYGYDAGNRLRTVTDSLAGTLTLTYDTLDRLTQEVSPQGTVAYSYDAASRRSSMTLPGQPVVTYGYDAADRLLQIAKGSAAVTFGYDAADRRTLLTLPNGVTTEYTYDVASQLTGLTYKQGAATLGVLTYAYDPAGNRTQASGSWARTGLPDPITSASYNAANHQLALGGRAMTYDLAGNLLTLAEPTGTTSFTWDARNQLSALTTPDGTASFLYDGLGRRRAKILNGTRTDYLYDGLTPVQELPVGSAAATLLTGLGIDEYFTRTTGATTRTLLTDALGSTVALTDATGALQAEYTYEPFGATTETGADSNPFQYTGREQDAGTGLYSYRARYYHPGLQRFVSEDPIGFAGGDVNFYAYVRNNPLLWIDPWGLRYTVEQLAAIIYNETAGYEDGGQCSLYGARTAIGNVAVNREAVGMLGGIAPASLGVQEERNIRGGHPRAGAAYAQALSVAAAVLAGRKDEEQNLVDPTRGALHFIFDYGQGLPRWARVAPRLMFGPCINRGGGGDVPRNVPTLIKVVP